MDTIVSNIYKTHYGGLFGVAIRGNDPRGIPVQWWTKLPNGKKVALAYEGGYTKMQTEDNNEARYYSGKIIEFDPEKWSTYTAASPPNVYDFRIKGDMFEKNLYTIKLMGRLVGKYINGGSMGKYIQSHRKLNDGTKVHMIFDDSFTKMVTEKNEAKYYTGPISNFDANNWNSYNIVDDFYGYMLIYGAEGPFIPADGVINTNREDNGETVPYNLNIPNSTRANNTTGSKDLGNSTGPNNTTGSKDLGNSTGANNTTGSKDLGSNTSSPPSDKVADTGGDSNILFYIMIFGAIACFGFMFILILIFVMSGDSQPKRSY
jgi:hypothetical protein